MYAWSSRQHAMPETFKLPAGRWMFRDRNGQTKKERISRDAQSVTE